MLTYKTQSGIQAALALMVDVPADAIEIRVIDEVNHTVTFRRVDAEMWAKLSKNNTTVKKNSARKAI